MIRFRLGFFDEISNNFFLFVYNVLFLGFIGRSDRSLLHALTTALTIRQTTSRFFFFTQKKLKNVFKKINKMFF